ncbi:MAG: hypothetical protein ACYTBV_16980, partial [Planctomycetota bacterium]
MLDPMEVYYRQCFGTGSGKIVLKNILMEAKLFDQIDTPEEMAVENFAKMILHKMGEYGDVKRNERLIERLFVIPRKEETGWLK